MVLILFLLAASAFAQTGEERRHIIGIVPNPPDSALGKIRLYENRVNGTNYLELVGQTSLTTNPIVTFPANSGNYTLAGLELPQVFTNSNTFNATTNFNQSISTRTIVPQANVTYFIGADSLRYNAILGSVDTHDVLPSSDGIRRLGSTSKRYLEYIASSQFNVLDSGGAFSRALLSTGGLSLSNSSGTVQATLNTVAGTADLKSGYLVNGTTVIDSSRNFTNSGNVTPLTDGVSTVGSTSKRYLEFIASSQFNVLDSGGFFSRALLGTAGLSLTDSGGVVQVTLSTTGGTAEVKTGYKVNGSSGTTNNLSCGTGTAVKAINVSGGIVLSVSCGAP